jgi:hypothetical protein
MRSQTVAGKADDCAASRISALLRCHVALLPVKAAGKGGLRSSHYVYRLMAYALHSL